MTLFLAHANSDARMLVMTQYVLIPLFYASLIFLRMALLLLQDRMEVDNGLIVAATGATVDPANVKSVPNVKFTPVCLKLSISFVLVKKWLVIKQHIQELERRFKDFVFQEGCPTRTSQEEESQDVIAPFRTNRHVLSTFYTSFV